MADSIKTIEQRMEAIRKACPSWKSDVTLVYGQGPNDHNWNARCNDIWGHIHSLVFYAKTPGRALEALEQYIQEITTKDIDDVPWEDDEGNTRGPQTYLGQPCGMGEIYLDLPST